MRHRLHERPLSRCRIKYRSVPAPRKWIVVCRATRREQTTVGKQGVPAAKEVEWPVIRCKNRGRMNKLICMTRCPLPNYRRKYPLRIVAKVGRRKARGATARPREK